VSGGFLASLDCTTRYSLWPFSQDLRHRLHLEIDLVGQEHCYFLFLECLNVALENSCELSTIRSWISIEDLLEAVVVGNPEWRRSATAVWEVHFIERREDQAYPCGVLGINLERHIRAQHLEWLLGCEIVGDERPSKRKKQK
jgi:hypothetical protein